MNQLQTQQDILQIIKDDTWMMDVLQLVKKHHLPDWWIGAGFVRSKVWDYLHERSQRTPLPDIDVIYFDARDLSEETEKNVQELLTKERPDIVWQVKNQARMHLRHNDMPYANATEGLSKWVETATCVGVTIDDKEELQLTAPLGVDDLVRLILRPNPTTDVPLELFRKRARQKHWLTLWPKLTVIIQ
jgi:hypothetical protein